MNKKKKKTVRFEKTIKSPKRKTGSGSIKGHKKILISELLHEAMQENQVSVRGLAKEAKISPSMVQDIRSGKKQSITLNSLVRIFGPLGYHVLMGSKKKIYALDI